MVWWINPRAVNDPKRKDYESRDYEDSSKYHEDAIARSSPFGVVEDLGRLQKNIGGIVNEHDQGPDPDVVPTP